MAAHDPRDLEWRRRYEENDTPWDKGAAAPPLVAYLKSSAITGRVLVPGCGRGHDVRALAAQPNCEAVGLDLAPMAVEDAKALAEKAGLEKKASFVLGDYFKMPAEMKGSFDWVVEHTCFCALEPKMRAEYVRASAEALKPEGKFFGIFYLTPDVEAGPPFAVSKEDLSKLFDPHFRLLDEWVPKESFPGREGRELVRVLQKR
jgi:SAM-dependent methyltransferase